MLPSEAPPPQVPPPVAVDWQRLHIASPILNGLTTAARLWPAFLILVFNAEAGPVIAIILGGAASVILTIEAARYLRFDYRLEGATLVVRSGVLVRRTRTVPADRVQQVSRNQRLRHRLFAVAEVLVEVAGSGSEPDVKLSVVSSQEAERLRIRLQDARRAIGSAPPAPDRVIYEQPNQALVRWATFASPIFLIPVAGAMVGTLGDLVDLEDAWNWLPDGNEVWYATVLGLIGLAVATGVNLIRFYDMRLVQADNNLRLEYGLLTHRRLELPLDRIQALVTKLTPAGRLAGTVGITAHNASSAGEATNSYLPAVPRNDTALLTGWLLPELGSEPEIQSHPRAGLRRSIIRWTMPTSVIVAVGLLLARSLAALLLIALIPAAATLGWRAWKTLGHAVGNNVVVSRRGALTERHAAVRRARVQSVSVAANWFQRRLHLATLRIDVAQPLGRVIVRDMGSKSATHLAELLVPTANAALHAGENQHDESGQQE